MRAPAKDSVGGSRPAGGRTRKRRIAVVGTVGLPARYGGFETLAHYLALHLAGEFELVVYCSGPDYPERTREFLGARLVYVPFRANGAQSILFDFCNYLHAWAACDLLLVLGVSGGLAMPLGRLLGKRAILNIGGLDWQRKKWGPWASRFLRMSESAAVRAADINVADNQGIAEYLQRAYGRSSLLIEYGGDQISAPAITAAHRAKYPFLADPYILALARIQADNNPELLLEAFDRMPDRVCVFIGNWRRSAYGRELAEKYRGRPHLRLLEAIYEPGELNAIRAHCSLYVHGHSAGGTNPSLVEAMHLSLPIAAFDVVYNRATTEDGARYFRNAGELADLVRGTPAQAWEAQRPVMKAIAQRRYRWERIAGEYARLFRTGARAEGAIAAPASSPSPAPMPAPTPAAKADR
jgi:glycosyltransferase involved in cell wall biosynthesis